MADIFTILSALAIAVSFLALTWFIHRLGLMEGQGFVRPVGAPLRRIPVQQMVGVMNPFQLHHANFEVVSQPNTLSSEPLKQENIKVVFSSSIPCYVTPYWGLDKNALAAAIEENEQSTINNSNADKDMSADDSVDEDLSSDESDEWNAAPMEHWLRGSYLARGSSEFHEPTSECEISLKIPEDLYLCQSNHFPFVLTMEMSRIDRQEDRLDNPSQIVSLINAFSITASKKCQEVEQFVQTADNRILSVKKLFVSETDILSDEVFPSLESDVRGHGHQRTDFTNSSCAICHSAPVTRALLPCRHACVCGDCFSRLNNCPLCRETIQSYFKVQEEPFPLQVDPEASEQLNRMSVWQIARGIFNAH